MANVNQPKCVSVPLERQRTVPVQGQHRVRSEAVLRRNQQDHGFHVSNKTKTKT